MKPLLFLLCLLGEGAKVILGGGGSLWAHMSALASLCSMSRARVPWLTPSLVHGEGGRVLKKWSRQVRTRPGRRRQAGSARKPFPLALAPISPQTTLPSPSSTLQERDRVPARDPRWTDQGPARTGMGWEVVGGRKARGGWSSRIPRRTTWCVPSFPPLLPLARLLGSGIAGW